MPSPSSPPPELAENPIRHNLCESIVYTYSTTHTHVWHIYHMCSTNTYHSYVQISIYVHVCLYTCIYITTPILSHLHIHIQIFIGTWICSPIYMHKYSLYTYNHICLCVNLHMYISMTTYHTYTNMWVNNTLMHTYAQLIYNIFIVYTSMCTYMYI